MCAGTTKQEIIDLYKALLQQENSNHTIFISVLMGITALLLGATWWWNKIGAERFIKTSVKEEIESEQKEVELKIEKKVNEIVALKLKEHDIKLSEAEFDIYRSIAITLHQAALYTHSIYWLSKAIDKGVELDQGELLRALAVVMISHLEALTVKEVHNLGVVKEIIKKLPDTLSIERKKIEELLKDCKNV
jgi:hypothetical protein